MKLTNRATIKNLINNHKTQHIWMVDNFGQQNNYAASMTKDRKINCNPTLCKFDLLA